MTQLTKVTKPISGDDIKREWHLIDIKGKIVGRVLTQISTLLQGKHKPVYSTHLDMGDYVVVINAAELRFSGDKVKTKVYDSFSGYPGGLRKETVSDLLKKNPAKIVINGVGGMLPKNKLKDKRIARLFVFADDKHPYAEKFAKKA